LENLSRPIHPRQEHIHRAPKLDILPVVHVTPTRALDRREQTESQERKLEQLMP
jgi:hypothetical protein